MRQHGDDRLGIGEQRPPRGLGIDGDLGQTVGIGLHFQAAVGEEEGAVVAQVAVGHVHDEERAHHLRAGSGLQDLQGRAQHVAGGVAGARDEAVRFAHLHHHHAEVQLVVHKLEGLLERHALRRAQLGQLLGIGLAQLGGAEVDDAGALQVAAGSGDVVGVAQDDEGGDALGENRLGGLEGADVVALGKHDGLLVGLRAGDHGIEELAHGNVLSHGYPALMIEHGPPPRTARPRGRFIYSVCMGFGGHRMRAGYNILRTTPPERRRPIRINEYEGENPLWLLITPISAISPSKTTTPSLSAPVLPGLSVPGSLPKRAVFACSSSRSAHTSPATCTTSTTRPGCSCTATGRTSSIPTISAPTTILPASPSGRATSTGCSPIGTAPTCPCPSTRTLWKSPSATRRRPGSSRSSSTPSATSARSPSTSCAPRRIRSFRRWRTSSTRTCSSTTPRSNGASLPRKWIPR